MITTTTFSDEQAPEGPISALMVVMGEDCVNHRVYAAAEQSVIRRGTRGRPAR